MIEVAVGTQELERRIAAAQGGADMLEAAE